MAAQTGRRTKFTPPQVAEMWGVNPAKIIAWIRSGELRAIDASLSPGLRPRYLIDLEDLREFERRRSVAPPTKTAAEAGGRSHK